MKAAKFLLAAAMFVPSTAGLVALNGCGSEPDSSADRKALGVDSRAALNDMEIADPKLRDFVANSAGYAIFPNIGKGGAGIEVATGNGYVFVNNANHTDNNGRHHEDYIGTSRMKMVGAGIDLGGQTYAELIVFQSPEAVDNFENAGFKFDASVSAVGVQAGAADTAKFQKGMAVFVQPHGGLMIEANLGAQEFTFKPANVQGATPPSTQP